MDALIRHKDAIMYRSLRPDETSTALYRLTSVVSHEGARASSGKMTFMYVYICCRSLYCRCMIVGTRSYGSVCFNIYYVNFREFLIPDITDDMRIYVTAPVTQQEMQIIADSATTTTSADNDAVIALFMIDLYVYLSAAKTEI